MEFKEVKGDLFQVDRSKFALAHCISGDVTATRNVKKGIAHLFQQEYPKMAGLRVLFRDMRFL